MSRKPSGVDLQMVSPERALPPIRKTLIGLTAGVLSLILRRRVEKWPEKIPWRGVAYQGAPHSGDVNNWKLATHIHLESHSPEAGGFARGRSGPSGTSGPGSRAPSGVHDRSRQEEQLPSGTALDTRRRLGAEVLAAARRPSRGHGFTRRCDRPLNIASRGRCAVLAGTGFEPATSSLNYRPCDRPRS